MSVSRRLILSVGVLMLLALGTVVSQVLIVSQMQQITEQVSTVGFNAARVLLEMQSETYGIEALSSKVLNFVEPAIREPSGPHLDDALKRFDQHFSELAGVLGPDQAPEEIALLSASWVEFKTLLGIARQTPPTQTLEELPLDVWLAIDTVRKRTESSQKAVIDSITQQVAKNKTKGDQAQQIAYGAAALFLLLGVIITFLTVRAINRPLQELTRGTRKIASGEFTHRLPVKGPSEFRELASDFNGMSEKLEVLDQMKKDFVAHVSHELKAPLAAIRQTLAVTLEQVPGPINDGQRRLLDLSRHSAERLSAMVSNLLDVSRLEAGTMEYEMMPHNIINIVNQTVEEFGLKASERKIDIKVESVTQNIPVVCDGDRMIQVVGNLLDNALKFSPENSTIRVRVGHNASAVAPAVRVAIADRGTGVPDAHKENVFLKFHQLNGGGRRMAGQGVGLGLAICKTIVDAHRGRIWVEDNPEGGSVFCVEIRSAPMKDKVKETVKFG